MESDLHEAGLRKLRAEFARHPESYGPRNYEDFQEKLSRIKDLQEDFLNLEEKLDKYKTLKSKQKNG